MVNETMNYDAQDLRAIESTGRMDANESIYFARQLEHVKPQAYDVKRPQLSALTLFPVDTSVNPGAETIKYNQYDTVGMAKILASYAEDFPRADIIAKEFISPVRGLGVSYAYSMQEIRASQMTGTNLSVRKMLAAKRANDEMINRLAWKGDTVTNLPGFLSNTNIPGYTVPATGTGTSKLFSTKTADQILVDLNGIVNTVFTGTKGFHRPTELWMPPAQYSLIAGMPRSATDSSTVLKSFLDNNPFVTRVVPVIELASDANGGMAGTYDVMVAAENSADNYQLVIPMAFMQHAPQLRNLEFTIPCESRIGGVIMEQPMAFCIADSI